MYCVFNGFKLQVQSLSYNAVPVKYVASSVCRVLSNSAHMRAINLLLPSQWHRVISWSINRTVKDLGMCKCNKSIKYLSQKLLTRISP
jgi:hypothetical protein